MTASAHRHVVQRALLAVVVGRGGTIAEGELAIMYRLPIRLLILLGIASAEMNKRRIIVPFVGEYESRDNR
jgi:hypothetical protein